MIRRVIGCLLVAMLPLLPLSALAANVVAVPSGVVKPAFFETQGITVLSFEKGPSGLNIWKVEHNGVKTVFYTTSDNKTLISGVMWDTKTGANLSDKFITPDILSAVQAPPAVDPNQYSPGKVPDAIRGVDALTGIREGKGGIDKTLYVMFDPRCPHCQAVHKKTRQFVASGGTIKWIPVTVLGRPDEGARLVADILQSSDQLQALVAVMGGRRQGAQPDAKTPKIIAENEAYFWSAFDLNKAAGNAGVPVAFFMSQKGLPQMIGGIDDDILLQQILTDMKK